MRIKVNSDKIIHLQSLSNSRMNKIQETYLSICDNLYHNASLLNKIRVSCKYPISLRMSHKGEFLDTGSYNCAELRKEWHRWWSISNQFPKPSPDTELWLDEYETEVFMFLQYKESL